jgi:DNA-binding NtrC family response regulator
MAHVETFEQAVLLVDDDAEALAVLEAVLHADGIRTIVKIMDAREVLPYLAEHTVGVVLLDLKMPHVSGEELLEEIAREYPAIPCIVVTGSDTLEAAVRCTRRGCFDFVVKPVEPARLQMSVRHALQWRELEDAARRMRTHILGARLEHPDVFASIITHSPMMVALFQYVEAIAAFSHPVLITGETGTGKELMSRAVHVCSGRKGQFVPVNVAGLDDALFSDTLFGHVKGAFTSADRVREGLLLQAEHGTIFLDEIGDLSAASQVKLLRLLQDGEYFPHGADRPRISTARVIVSTNVDLEEYQRDGRFRRDLYYRLSAYHIAIPPLRQRLDDLPLLVEHFVGRFAQERGIAPPKITESVVEMLARHTFPGNIRELRSMVLDALAWCGSEPLTAEAFQHKLRAVSHAQPSAGVTRARSGAFGSTLEFPERLPTLRETTDLLIAEALRRADGKQTTAARLLGISQQALSRRLAHSRGKKPR